MAALMDGQVPTERAFAAPMTIALRLGREDLYAQELAFYDPRKLIALFTAPPAVHAFPALTARQVQELCRFLLARYGGDAARLWKDTSTGKELLGRVKELPGFGRQKSQIFVALLGKQYGIRPEGWREAAGTYGEEGDFRSVADVTGPASLAIVRTFRQEERRTAKRRPGPSSDSTERCRSRQS
ncbi:HhH-GPD-type base excision DNA repair protein [Kitasatospora sp. NPDC054939]